MIDKTRQPGVACSSSYETDANGLSHWTETHADAWIGLLETHKQLIRALDAELTAQHGLSLSALELLARLAAADDRSLHLTALAGASGLSLSRVSRIIDSLQARGLVARRACPHDARAVHAQLSETGLELVIAAQATHFASVQAAFFDQLDYEEIATLARVFEKFAPRAAGLCDAGRQ
ncbi:MAG TPA: MarR family transcriptional regulator [Solirubrobacteraceae bacterium]|nr:MarR family transcriptional regulator [Solirubrobacteraceae bacterium]